MIEQAVIFLRGATDPSGPRPTPQTARQLGKQAALLPRNVLLLARKEASILADVQLFMDRFLITSSVHKPLEPDIYEHVSRNIRTEYGRMSNCYSYKATLWLRRLVAGF